MPKVSDSSVYNLSSLVREVVFGMEDGMVSTLGAISGIAVGAQNKSLVLLSGVVIIGVEAISMGIGSYLSNRTSKEIDEHSVKKEKEGISNDSEKGKTNDLLKLFKRDGWPTDLANKMVNYALDDKKLYLREVQYRELGISSFAKGNPLKNAIFMYFAYTIGGLIPLSSYFFLPVSKAMPWSVIFTLICLFGLGVATTRFTKSLLIKSGLRIMILGGIALVVGVVIGEIASKLDI